MVKVTIASDHAGFILKNTIKDWLISNQHSVHDKGCDRNEVVDYPDYVHGVVHDVRNKIADYGILICGSGAGMSITANRYSNIRAVLCYNTEIARLAREHNNANIICLGAIFTGVKDAQEILNSFLHSNFTGGRHESRLEKLESLKGR